MGSVLFKNDKVQFSGGTAQFVPDAADPDDCECCGNPPCNFPICKSTGLEPPLRTFAVTIDMPTDTFTWEYVHTYLNRLTTTASCSGFCYNPLIENEYNRRVVLSVTGLSGLSGSYVAAHRPALDPLDPCPQGTVFLDAPRVLISGSLVVELYKKSRTTWNDPACGVGIFDEFVCDYEIPIVGYIQLRTTLSTVQVCSVPSDEYGAGRDEGGFITPSVTDFTSCGWTMFLQFDSNVPWNLLDSSLIDISCGFGFTDAQLRTAALEACSAGYEPYKAIFPFLEYVVEEQAIDGYCSLEHVCGFVPRDPSVLLCAASRSCYDMDDMDACSGVAVPSKSCVIKNISSLTDYNCIVPPIVVGTVELEEHETLDHTALDPLTMSVSDVLL